MVVAKGERFGNWRSPPGWASIKVEPLKVEQPMVLAYAHAVSIAIEKQ
jgi:hypothetical protein